MLDVTMLDVGEISFQAQTNPNQPQSEQIMLVIVVSLNTEALQVSVVYYMALKNKHLPCKLLLSFLQVGKQLIRSRQFPSWFGQPRVFYTSNFYLALFLFNPFELKDSRPCGRPGIMITITFLIWPNWAKKIIPLLQQLRKVTQQMKKLWEQGNMQRILCICREAAIGDKEMPE